MDKIFGIKGVTGLGGTPPHPFTDKVRKVVFDVPPKREGILLFNGKSPPEITWALLPFVSQSYTRYILLYFSQWLKLFFFLLKTPLFCARSERTLWNTFAYILFIYFQPIGDHSICKIKTLSHIKIQSPRFFYIFSDLSLQLGIA